MSVTLYANDSYNLTTGEVIRNDTTALEAAPVERVDTVAEDISAVHSIYRRRLERNDPNALAFFITRDFAWGQR